MRLYGVLAWPWVVVFVKVVKQEAGGWIERPERGAPNTVCKRARAPSLAINLTKIGKRPSPDAEHPYSLKANRASKYEGCRSGLTRAVGLEFGR